MLARLARQALHEIALSLRRRAIFVLETLRGEIISREEAARIILQVPDDEWRGGRVIELSKYRRAARGP